jgi:protein-tyrosine phosphatase
MERVDGSDARRVLFVCHGNICRSTMAEYVARHLACERGLAARLSFDSAATSREEIGNGVHPGTRRKLAEVGIACGNHRARQMMRADYDSFDLLVGMDAENIRGMMRILGSDPEGKVHRLLDWTDAPRDIADPWYTGDFDATYDDVLRGVEALLSQLASRTGESS